MHRFLEYSKNDFYIPGMGKRLEKFRKVREHVHFCRLVIRAEPSYFGARVQN